MKSLSHKILAALTVFTVGGLVWVAFSRLPGSSSSFSTLVEDNQGQLQSYSFNYKSEGSVNVGILTPSSTGSQSALPISLSVKGKLFVLPAGISSKEFRILVHVDELNAGDTMGKERSDEINRELQDVNFEIRQSSENEVPEWNVPGELSRTARDLLVDLSAWILVQTPDQQPSLSRSQDQNGEFEIRFQKLSTSTMTRSKERYVKTSPGLKIEISHSNFDLQWEKDSPLPSHYKGTEELSFSTEKSKLGWSRVALEVNRTKVAIAEQTSWKKKLETLSTHEQAGPSDSRMTDEGRVEDSMARNRLGNLKLDDLLQLDRSRREGQDIDQTDLARKFVALARLHPEQCLELAKGLDQLSPEDFLFQTVLTALAEADHRAAQEALVQIARDRRDEDASLATIYGVFALVKAPQSLLLEHLQQTALDHKDKDVRNSSRLAMASVARKLPDQTSQAAAASLNNEYLQATSIQDKIFLLRQMGNLGHPSLFPLLNMLSSGTEADLKINAIRAMRFIPLGSVDDRLQEITRTASAELDISAAMQALLFREPNQALLKAYTDLIGYPAAGINDRLEALDRALKLVGNTQDALKYLQRLPTKSLPQKLKNAISKEIEHITR